MNPMSMLKTWPMVMSDESCAGPRGAFFSLPQHNTCESSRHAAYVGCEMVGCRQQASEFGVGAFLNNMPCVDAMIRS